MRQCGIFKMLIKANICWRQYILLHKWCWRSSASEQEATFQHFIVWTAAIMFFRLWSGAFSRTSLKRYFIAVVFGSAIRWTSACLCTIFSLMFVLVREEAHQMLPGFQAREMVSPAEQPVLKVLSKIVLRDVMITHFRSNFNDDKSVKL